MKLGVSFFSFEEDVGLDEAFEQVAKAGYSGVELVMGRTGELTPDTPAQKLRDIRRRAESFGLSVISVGANNVWEHNLASDDEEERRLACQNIKRQIDAAGELGADVALVVPGWVGTPFAQGCVSYHCAYQNSQKELMQLAPYAQRAGVSIAIENVWNKFLLSPIEMARFLDEINSPYVGAYFDIGNIIYIGYPEQWIRILSHRIKRLQFCDCRAEQAGLGMFVDIFEGDVNFREVMRAVYDIGYDGWGVVEIFPRYRSFPYQAIINNKLSMDTILALE